MAYYGISQQILLEDIFMNVPYFYFSLYKQRCLQSTTKFLNSATLCNFNFFDLRFIQVCKNFQPSQKNHYFIYPKKKFYISLKTSSCSAHLTADFLIFY